MTPTAVMEVHAEAIDATELTQKLQTLADRGFAIRVTDNITLKIADNYITDCLAMEKEIKTKFEKPKAKAAAAHKELCAWEKAELEKVTPGKEYAKTQKFTFELAEKKRREAEEARLLKEARDREEAERIERAAEQEKEAARLKAIADQEAAEADRLKALGREEEAATLMAQSEMKAGEAEAVQEEAIQVMNTPTYVPPPRMAPALKVKNALKMVVDRTRLETIAASLNQNPRSTPPVIPGVRFYQSWHVEVYAAASVPEAYRKPA
jgi:regulator of protease activity HflC (stomatin/prohibitin superfamily)